MEINNEIAACFLLLGEKSKAAELMKQSNVYGINSAAIGMLYATDLNQPMEAMQYLAQSFGICMEKII